MRAAGQQEAPSTAVTFKREKVMEMFKDFNVKGVHSWGDDVRCTWALGKACMRPGGSRKAGGLSHRRTIVVLSFQEGLAGLSGAKDFEQRFKDARQGREEWRMKHERRGGNHLDGHAYGWLADEETLTKDDCGPKVQKYLREKCEFKTLSQMEENERERTARTKACLLEANANLKEEQVAHDKHRQRFEDVLKEQTEKNSLLQADLKEQQEQAARKHDNAVAELKAQLRNAAVGQAEKEKIQRQKDEEMKKKQSEVDRAVALSKKHEKESAEMQMKMLELTRKQGLELRLSRLSLGGDAREEESEEYQSLKEEKEGLEESLNAVMVAERRANDELSAAKKFLIYLLSEKQLVEDLRSSRVAGTYKLRDVGVKKMGDLDMSIWNQTAEILARKHPSMADKWEEKVVMEASAFVKKLRNPSFEPFTIINPDTNPKKVLRKDDPAFVDLRKKLGDKVVADAQRALMELDEHNPSGRYPVPKLWHAREKRLATAEEACRLLARMLEAQHKLYNEDCGTEVKKRRVPP
eukprot:jgi/Mesen1/1472/ME000132S00418